MHLNQKTKEIQECFEKSSFSVYEFSVLASYLVAKLGAPANIQPDTESAESLLESRVPRQALQVNGLSEPVSHFGPHLSCPENEDDLLHCTPEPEIAMLWLLWFVYQLPPIQIQAAVACGALQDRSHPRAF